MYGENSVVTVKCRTEQNIFNMNNFACSKANMGKDVKFQLRIGIYRIYIWQKIVDISVRMVNICVK
jgi:hypothetical protein